MRRLLTWLWLVPVPLTFALELLIGSGWALILGNVIAVAVGLPILIRAQLRPGRSARLEWAVLGLLKRGSAFFKSVTRRPLPK